jgi:phospholipid/cholesterol/gamma-HCH transport system substrate-binding protein
MKNSLETRLGLFFALTLLAAVFVLEMAGGMDFFKPGYHLRARFSTAQELKVGDVVKMAGVQVGKVEKIGFAPDEDKVEISMKIDKNASVKTDAKATIKFAGLMGQNFVSIGLGTGKTVFTDGQLIQTTEQPDLNVLMTKLENVATGVENVTKSFSGDSIQNILGPFTDFMKQNQNKLGTMIGNIQFISQQVADGKGTVGKLINDDELYKTALGAVKNLNDTATEVKGMMDDAKGLLGDAKLAINDARGALSEAKTTVTEINQGKGTIGKLIKDDSLYKDASGLMSNMREISEKMNRGQGTVGKLINDESLLKNAQMTLQKVDKATEELEDQGPLTILTSVIGKLF